MKFAFTEEQETFRAEVRAFIDETLTPEFWAEHRASSSTGSHAASTAGTPRSY
jgi:hypothetical protein